MKKFLLPLIAIALFVVQGNAQDNTFNKGDKVVNLGVGFGSNLYSGSGYDSKTPPISASYEVGVKDDLFDEFSSLGVGGYVGYTGAKYAYLGGSTKFSSIVIGARGALHYQFIDDLDTYTGLMLGYNIVSVSGTDFPGASASEFAFSWFLGGRYYFSDKFAGLVELGSGVAYFTIGVAIKL